MSRWGRGRGASVAVPLDHLFRENSNCPSAARSAATVGKWGITSFTSTRNAPFSFGGSESFKKPKKEDQNSPLTVPVIEPNLPPPKPKKFFKSRNVDPSENATLPTSSVAPPQAPSPQPYPTPSFGKKDDKPPKPFTKKSPKHDTKKAPEKLEIPKLKIHVERSPKNSKNKFFSKSKKEEEPPVEKTHLSPNKRYLVRNRDKIINYSEDRSNSPPPLPLAPAQPPAAMKVSTPKLSPAVPAASPTYVKPGLLSPTNKDGKPPIVLRISKGTSRLLSTDSEDIVTSPTADRHSQSALDERPSEPESTACPITKQEGLKMTIKCFGNKEKSSKHKGKSHKDNDSGDNEKETVSSGRTLRASKRNHKEVEETPKPASPTPGSDNYELYRTLASPTATPLSPRMSPHSSPGHTAALQSVELKTPVDSDVEMKLAKLDSGQPLDLHVPTEHTKQIPEPKPPESSSGRTMRHRTNINYNENVNSYIDDITTSRFSKNSAKSYVRKNKKKVDVPTPMVEDVAPVVDPPEVTAALPEPAPTPIITNESQKTRTEPNPQPPVEPPAVAANNNSDSVKDSIKIRIPKKTILTEPMEEDPPENFEFSDTPQDIDVNKSEKCKSPEKHTFKSPKRLGDSSPNEGDEDKPSVKLVITKKKGSIFKSRSLVNDGPGAAGKKRHLYRHKWADDGKGGQTPRPEPEPSAQVALQEFEEESSALTRVTRYQKDKNPTMEDEIEPYTSVKCPKNAKDYYTVVRNVKKAHQIQEIGEFQEFNDDVEYILDALQDNNPMSTRCLSAITLASKCMAPAFRMHVRAHGTVAKFFRALHDATNDQSLGLCTATVMFVLSQDRLNMDLDRESLELMLNLLESDVSHKDALDDCGLTSVQLCKNKERVRELCAEIKNQGKAKHLDLDNITVGHLAMETLLSLTSKRAGEWFKEELRALGGIEHILSTICDCCATIGEYGVEWSPLLLDLLRKVDRCMRVLENVTTQNEENQTYLLNWRNGLAVDTLVRLFRLCDREIPLYPTGGEGAAAPSAGSTNSSNAQGTSSIIGATIRDALLPTLKVLVNLTHPFTSNSVCSSVVGERPGIIDASLHLLLQATNYIPEKNNFEFSVCVLLLLINLMQNNTSNVKLLMEAKAPADHEAVFTCNKPALLALIDHFYKRVEFARLAEQNTDAILDGEKSKEDEKEKKNKSHDEFIEETVEKLLQKAGTHMEHTMIGSYIVLLLGHVAMGSEEYETRIRNLQPNNNYEEMLTVLRKYFSFLNLTASSEAASVAHVKNTQKVIDFLESSDKMHSGKAEDAAGPSTSSQPCPSPPSSSIPDKDSMTSDSNLDLTNNSNVSGNEITSESDRMSSSVDMDTSFN